MNLRIFQKHLIKKESLSTESCFSYFYHFDKPDFRKEGVESGWSVTDREGIAPAMAMGNEFCSQKCKNQYNVANQRNKRDD